MGANGNVYASRWNRIPDFWKGDIALILIKAFELFRWGTEK
jgi:hypothetical protein